MTNREEIIIRLNELKYLPKNQGRITASSLAKIINPSNPKSVESRLSQFKKGKGPKSIAELHFCEYYEIAKLLFKDTFKETFTKWCFEFKNYENILNAFEFASTNRCFDLTNHLLEFVKNISSTLEVAQKLKECAAIYTIVRSFQDGTKSSKEVRQLLRRFYPRFKIGQTLKTIIECNTLYKDMDFRSICRLIDDARFTVRSINYPYIKWSYKIRIFELMSQINLYAKSHTKLCRKYAKVVIKSDIGHKFQADSYNVIGMSYLYENREMCLKYHEIYHQMILDENRNELAKSIKDTTIAFVNNVWGFYIDTEDLAEQAHFHAKWGDKEKAKMLIEEAIKQQGESAYKLLYKGLAYDDIGILSNALALFLSGDNKFHAKLVTQNLKTPEYSHIFETILNTYRIY